MNEVLPSGNWTPTVARQREKGSCCGENPKNRPSDTQCSMSPAEPVRFACPYLKANPRRTQANSTCARSTWPSIARLKEHLYRRHAQQKVSCPRCAAPFEREKELSDHLRARKPCKVLDPNDRPSQTMSSAQMHLVRSRKTQHRETEEDKWFKIFSILFPEQDKPASPYADCHDGLWGWDNHIMGDLQESITTTVAALATNELGEELLLRQGAGVDHRVQQIIANHIGAAFDQYKNRGSLRQEPDRNEQKWSETRFETSSLPQGHQDPAVWTLLQEDISDPPTLTSQCSTVVSSLADYSDPADYPDYPANIEITSEWQDTTNVASPLNMSLGLPSDTSALTISQENPAQLSHPLRQHDVPGSLPSWFIPPDPSALNLFPMPPLDLGWASMHNGPEAWKEEV